MLFIIILMYFGMCGFFARGLFIGDTLVEFEKYYRENGPITFKGSKLSFKAFFASALLTKMVLGVFILPSDVIYKLLTKKKFYFRTSLPDDFWTRYFKEEQP